MSTTTEIEVVLKLRVPGEQKQININRWLRRLGNVQVSVVSQRIVAIERTPPQENDRIRRINAYKKMTKEMFPSDVKKISISSAGESRIELLALVTREPLHFNFYVNFDLPKATVRINAGGNPALSRSFDLSDPECFRLVRECVDKFIAENTVEIASKKT